MQVAPIHKSELRSSMKEQLQEIDCRMNVRMIQYQIQEPSDCIIVLLHPVELFACNKQLEVEKNEKGKNRMSTTH